MVNWVDKFKLKKQAKKEASWRADLVNFYLNKAGEDDKESDVNIVDKETDGEVSGQPGVIEDFTREFPAGEIQQETNTGPEFDQYKRPRQAEIGQELTQLTTERETGKTRQKDTTHGMTPDSYRDDNKFEDADLKLGESQNDDTDPIADAVYPPYSQGTGPFESRYEDADKNKHNIVLHATDEIDPNKGPEYIWICVDLDGTILEPPPNNNYQCDEGDHLFGEPTDGAREAMQELVDGGARVSVYTARQYFDENEDGLRDAVEYKLTQYDIPFTDVYIGKKPPAHFFVDDRTIPPFNGDWDLVLDAVRDKLKKNANDPVKDIVDYHGIKIDIEWPKGSIRSYEGDDTYVSHMKCHYGYARGIEGNDGEELDIYLGDKDSDIAYIVEQVKEDGSYDEDKIMLGFESEGEAIDMYLAHMPAYMLGDVREFPVERFVNALYGKPEDRRGEEDLVPSEEKEAGKTTILPDGSAFFTGLVETDKDSQKVFDPKIEKKTKSDYVGPQTSQSGGIGGPAADSDVESSIWPDIDENENEWLDSDETRKNRDINRSPEMERARYRNA